MFAAETAILHEFKSVGVVFLVFLCVIVTLFAFAAGKSNFNSHYRHLLENFGAGKPHRFVPPSVSGAAFPRHDRTAGAQKKNPLPEVI